MHKLFAVVFVATLLALPLPEHVVKAAEAVILTMSCDGTTTRHMERHCPVRTDTRARCPSPHQDGIGRRPF